MRIILLANNWVGWKISQYLVQRNETVIALGIHEKEKQKYIKEILSAVTIPRCDVFTAIKLRDSMFVKRLKYLEPDFIIAAFWGYILKPEVIKIPRYGCINFHPGYLPYNRGMNPNVWPFIEGTPAGVTIHYIDPGIDTGDIIARKKTFIDPFDTAGTLYEKTLKEIVALFKAEWPKIRSRKEKRIKQKTLGKGTHHFAKNIFALDEIDLNKTYTARDLINRLRARSYPDRYFSYYMDKGKKVYIRVQLSYKDK